MRVLTFDVEDWFHLLDHESTRDPRGWDRFDGRLHHNVARILEALARHGQSATFFCLGWVAEKYPDVIREIDRAGHEIGSHSHHHQLVYEQGRDAFVRDLDESLRLLGGVTGKPVRYYRAPGFSITRTSLWAFEALMERGIEIDCSLFAPKRAHGGISDIALQEPFILEQGGRRIKEFPMTYFRVPGAKLVFSGGGYFRLFPYPMIKAMTRRSDYLMTYFHPRDFDPGQPVISGLSRARRFKSYYGLEGAFAKLEALIRDFSFLSLSEADAMVDWERAPVVPVPRGAAEAEG